MKKEIWKDVIGYEGLYQVSNLGKVRNCRLINNKLVKGRINEKGYAIVGLTNKNGHYAVRRIHRLVAQAFIPNPNEYQEINHKNFIRTDNRAENLEWISHKDNIKYSYINGRYEHCGKYRGIREKVIIKYKNGKTKTYDTINIASQKLKIDRHIISYLIHTHSTICNDTFSTPLSFSFESNLKNKK